MKKIFVFCFLIILFGCQSIQPPKEFVYNEINTSQFKLATWQKITDVNADYRIYIEGDGYAFNTHGQPSQNPTPHGELVRELSFNDVAPNVIYLARPCQFVKDNACRVEYWTTKRFAPEVVEAEYEAIKKIVSEKTLIKIFKSLEIFSLVFTFLVAIITYLCFLLFANLQIDLLKVVVAGVLFVFACGCGSQVGYDKVIKTIKDIISLIGGSNAIQ